MVLNKNPENYFAEVEQATFNPSNFIPGIGPSPDKMLQGRLFAYGDAHRYRVGVNHNDLKINAPIGCPYHNSRGGHMATSKNYGSSTNYFPNSQPDGAIIKNIPKLPEIKINDFICKYNVETYEDDFIQPRDFYTKVLSEKDKESLINNLSDSLIQAKQNLQLRQTSLFYKVNEELGSRLCEKLGLDIELVKTLAKLSQEDRVSKTPFIN